MSLAVGETHGNGVPRRITNPAGVECDCRRVGGENVRLLRGRELYWLEGPDPWFSPTANDIVPLRGTHECQFERTFASAAEQAIREKRRRRRDTPRASSPDGQSPSWHTAPLRLSAGFGDL